jgi:ribosomal protein L37AE/L43A
MKANPPPPTCDQCKRMPRWERLTGPDHEVHLDDARIVLRRGQVWVCTHCGHSTPVSFEAWT